MGPDLGECYCRSRKIAELLVFTLFCDSLSTLFAVCDARLCSYRPSTGFRTNSAFNSPVQAAVTYIRAGRELGLFRITISTSRPSAFRKCIIRSTENPPSR